MKKVEELEAELVVVSGKNKADIVAFAKLLIADYGALLVLDANAELLKKESEVGNLTELVKTLTGEKNSLSEELETAKEVAKEALEQVNSVDANQVKAKTIKIDGKVVNINFGVNFNGVNYTVDDLSANSKVVKELLEIGSGSVELKKEDK